MIDLGKVKPGSTIRIPWGSYTASTGASSAASNYAAADILIYQDGSTTERASTSGFTATTTFDTLTGINVTIINLADNTTAGFFAAGSEYFVIVGPVTVDSQTVYFPIARFIIGIRGAVLDTTIATLSSQTSFTLTAGPAEDNALNGCIVYIHDVASAVQGGFAVVQSYTGSSKTVTLVAGTTFTAAASDNISVFQPALVPTTLGRTLDVSAGGEAGVDWANVGSPTTTVGLTGTTIATTQKVDVETIKTNPVVNGGTITFPTGATLASTTNITAGTITTATNLTNAPTNGDLTATMKTSVTTACTASTPTAAAVTGAVGSVTGNVGGNVTGSVGSVAAGGITAASIATDAIDADALAADAIAEINATVDTALADYDAPTNTEMIAAFTEIKGATWSSLTDTLEHIRDKETDIETDTAAIGAAGAGLTALAQASVCTEARLAELDAANLPTDVAANASAIAALNDFDPATDVVAHVTLVDTTTAVTNEVAADVQKINANSDAADILDRSARNIVRGTCTTGGSTTSIVVSALDPASAVNDQFNGRIVIFDKDTTTAALRGQATDITDFDHASQTFTVTALTTSPASDDTFTIQ